MKRNDIIFAACVAAVVAVLYILSISGTKPPDIPPDAVHAAVTAKQGCMDCHSEEGENPLEAGHPPKDQCFECHGQKAGRHGVMR